MKVRADEYFAVIPEWVLYGDISPAAVRVFGVLNRYANSDTGKCHPSRKSIAQKAKIGLSTVDRSIDELVRLGAVIVRHQKSESGDFTSNEYTLIMNRGLSNLNRGLSTENRPSIQFEQTGLFKSDNQTIAILNESQEPDTSSSDEREKPVDEQLAAEWWESRQRKPLGDKAWFALRNVIKAALKRDYSPQEITAALNRYGTVPSLAALDKELQNRRPQSRRERNILEALQYSETVADYKEITDGKT